MPKEKCVDCGKELGFLKIKPTEKEWGIEGYLCGDCYNKRKNADRASASVIKLDESGKSVLDTEMSDEDILSAIKQNQLEISDYEPKAFPKFGLALALSKEPDLEMRHALKVIAELNKIIIRQNELNRRLLQKIAEKP